MTPDSSLLSGTTLSLATNSSSTIEILTNCLIMLKAASSNNPQYIDRIMGPFMKILQKLYRDHLNATCSLSLTISSQVPASSTSAENSNIMNGTNSTSITCFTELLIQMIDLIKYRVGVMSLEMRKMFINLILVTLLEKSVDLRLIRYIINLISDWIRYKNGPLMNQIPSMKEKLILLQKLTISIEKRFSEHTDIHKIFLETIAYVYKEEAYNSNSDFKVKLEQVILVVNLFKADLL